ncbi:MAG: autotransporter-associated beta strand repeat-containing protein [Terrimicrobiaceae bacterium]
MKRTISPYLFTKSLGIALLCLAGTVSAQASNLFWDANGGTSGTGGAGAWDTTSSLWRLDSDVGTLQTYDNTVGNMTANFGGTAGTVTIAAATTIHANLINITGNYTIAGGSGRFLNLDGTTPTINVTGTSGYDGAGISAAITGSGGLAVTGSGIIRLTGTNSYTGTTTVNGGTTLRAADGTGLTSGNLVLNGGIFQTTTDFTRSLGTGANQVSITGGTSGFGGNNGQTRIVAIGGTGSPTALVWGNANFNPTVFELNNNTYSGTVVDFRNAIDLNGADRTIHSTATAYMKGDITGSSKLSKTGNGTLYLYGNNSFSGGFDWVDTQSYVLALGSDTALGSGLTTLNSTSGSVRVQAADATDRVLANNLNIAETALIFGSSTTGNLTFGNLTSGGGQTITIDNAKTTFSSYSATGGTFTKGGTGAMIVTGNFTRGSANTFTISNGALAVGGTWNVNTVATLGSSGASAVLGRNGSMTGALNATEGVRWAAGTSLGGGLFAYGTSGTWGNAANNLAVNFGGSSATLTWGQTNFVQSGQTLIFGNTVSNGTVTFQNAIDLGAALRTVDVVQGTSNLSGGSDAILSGVLSNGGLNKTGNGKLELTAVNTYTGDTVINAGTLLLADNAELSFLIGNSGVNNSISGVGSLLLDGDISFNLGGAAAAGSWLIVAVDSLSETYGSTFTVVGFTESEPNSGIWESGDYTFTESTGILNAVPEPSAGALILAGGALLLRRRRR